MDNFLILTSELAHASLSVHLKLSVFITPTLLVDVVKFSLNKNTQINTIA